MISKLIEDSGIEEQEPKDLNNHFEQQHDDDESAISPLEDADVDEDEDDEGEEGDVVHDIAKSDMAIKTTRGNPIGPATAGLAILIPSSYSAGVIKGSFPFLVNSDRHITALSHLFS